MSSKKNANNYNVIKIPLEIIPYQSGGNLPVLPESNNDMNQPVDEIDNNTLTNDNSKKYVYTSKDTGSSGKPLETFSGSYSFNEIKPLNNNAVPQDVIREELYTVVSNNVRNNLINSGEFGNVNNHHNNNDSHNSNFIAGTYHLEIKGVKMTTNNDKVNIFLKDLCKSKVEPDNLSSLVNEISKNLSMYEKETYRIDILKYRICNFLTNLDKVDDGFFDIGPNNFEFSSHLTSFIKSDVTNNDGVIMREVIYFDPSRDAKLSLMIERAVKYQKNNKIYINLIVLIESFLGDNKDDRLFNRFLIDHIRNTNSNLLLIGDTKFSLDRHKSLLYKYLCDKLNLKCSLVRKTGLNETDLFTDKHVWNLILVDGVVHVVDFKYHSGKIITPIKETSKSYYEIDKFVL